MMGVCQQLLPRLVLALSLLVALMVSAIDCHAKGVALILSISDYGPDTPALEGVAHDRASADLFAAQLGVAPEHRLYFADQELTRDGFDSAFNALDRQVSDGDSVFIYYSGHGFRTQRRDAPPGVCVSSLITADQRSFREDELMARIEALSLRASQVVVMLDACHSGGSVEARRASTRSLGGSGQRFRPRQYVSPDGDKCKTISNVTPARTAAMRALPGQGGDNIVIFAAARPDEVSLDDPEKGGLATSSLAACLTTALDGDASGMVTYQELMTCAQARIDNELKGNPDFKPHHLTIAGNPARPFAPASLKQMPATETFPTPSPTHHQDGDLPGTACGQATISLAGVRDGKAASALMQDLYYGRDDRRVVTVTPEKSRLRVCKDKLAFTVSSSFAGYLYVLQLGSDGETFNLLYPNELDTRDNYLRAGEQRALPGGAFDIVMQGPVGKNRLLVLVSDSRRNFQALKRTDDNGALAAYSTGSAARAGLSRALTRVRCDKAECQSPYGAALLEIEEVP